MKNSSLKEVFKKISTGTLKGFSILSQEKGLNFINSIGLSGILEGNKNANINIEQSPIQIIKQNKDKLTSFVDENYN